MNKVDVGLGLGLGWLLGKITEGSGKNQPRKMGDTDDSVTSQFTGEYASMEDQIEAEILYDLLEELNFLRKEAVKGQITEQTLQDSQRLLSDQEAEKKDEYDGDWNDHIEEIYGDLGIDEITDRLMGMAQGGDVGIEALDIVITKHNDRLEDLEITQEEYSEDERK